MLHLHDAFIQPYLLNNMSSAVDPSLLRTFSCGMMTQCFEIMTLGHVLDRIKIEQQSNLSLRTFRQTTTSLVNKGGVRELYRGIHWNVVQGSLKAATRWGLNGACFKGCEALLGPQFRHTNPGAFSGLVGFSAAFLDTTLFVCPLESIKVRDMTSGWKGRSHMLEVVKEEGFGLLFRGWSRVFMKQVASSFTACACLFPFPCSCCRRACVCARTCTYICTCCVLSCWCLYTEAQGSAPRCNDNNLRRGMRPESFARC